MHTWGTWERAKNTSHWSFSRKKDISTSCKHRRVLEYTVYNSSWGWTADLRSWQQKKPPAESYVYLVFPSAWDPQPVPVAKVQWRFGICRQGASPQRWAPMGQTTQTQGHPWWSRRAPWKKTSWWEAVCWVPASMARWSSALIAGWGTSLPSVVWLSMHYIAMLHWKWHKYLPMCFVWALRTCIIRGAFKNYLGKPSDKKSAVFFKIVQRRWTSPPLSLNIMWWIFQKEF